VHAARRRLTTSGREPVSALHGLVTSDRELWLALPGDAPTPALLPEDGAPIHPVGAVPDEWLTPRPSIRTVRWSLEPVSTAGPPGEVLLPLVVPDGPGWRPVRLAHCSPTRTVDAGRPELSFQLGRDGEGHAVLRLVRRPPASELLEASHHEGAARLVCRRPREDAGPAALLLQSGDDTALTLPMTPANGALECLLRGQDVPAQAADHDLVVLVDDERFPLVRRDDGLADPGSVARPYVLSPSGDRVAAQLHFTGDGAVRLRTGPTPVSEGA
jgi:hypothetical protein